MATDLNNVSITGRLTRDPEMRATAGGTSVVSMRVAVNGREKRGDDWQDYANFLDITVFGRQADSCEQYLAKGRRIAVDGRLRWREWEKDGYKRQAVEIVAREVIFLGDNAQSGESSPSGARASSDMPYDDGPATSAPDDDDDVPF